MTGSIIRRGERSWRLKFDLPDRNASGRRQTRYVTVKGTKKDAERELRRLLGSVDTGNFVDPSKLTVGEWLDQWLAEAMHNVSPTTHQRYTEIVMLHLRPAFGAVALAKLQPVHLQRYYTQHSPTGAVTARAAYRLRPLCILIAS